jgi:hypothetical protein
VKIKYNIILFFLVLLGAALLISYLNNIDSKERALCAQISVFSIALKDFNRKGKVLLAEDSDVVNIAAIRPQLLDPWGMSLIFLGETKSIYSSGQNKIDEGGLGDDITCSK